VFIFQLMKSRVVLGLAVFSLLLAIAVGVMWIRSYTYYDAVYYANLERSHQLFTVPGSVVFSTWNHLPADDFVWSGDSGLIGMTPMKLFRDGKAQDLPAWDNPPSMKLGFWWERGTVDLKQPDGTLMLAQSHLNLAFPFWVPILVLLIPPIAWVLKLWQRYKRARTGHCIYCNADMPTPDRCPNCEAEFDSWFF